MSKKKQKDGPKVTRNKKLKADRSSQQHERLRNVIAHQRWLEENRNKPQVEVKGVKKTRRISTKESAIKRREGALHRLNDQLMNFDLQDAEYKEQKKQVRSYLVRQIDILEKRLK